MKLQIRDKIVNTEVTTIAIVEQVSGHKLWSCPTCRTPLFQYQGRVIAIIPGEVPVEIPILIQCSTCKQKYLLKTILSREV